MHFSVCRFYFNKEFFKNHRGWMGELDLETGIYAVKTLGIPSPVHRESLPSRYQPTQALLWGYFGWKKAEGPRWSHISSKTFFYLLIGELHPVQQWSTPQQQGRKCWRSRRRQSQTQWMHSAQCSSDTLWGKERWVYFRVWKLFFWIFCSCLPTIMSLSS